MKARNTLLLAALLSLPSVALPSAALAQAGASKEEKDDEKVERTGYKNGAVKVKVGETKRPVIEVTPPAPPAPAQPPSPSPYKPQVDYHGPIPYVDDNGRIRNLHDHTFMSKAEADAAPWYAEKTRSGVPNPTHPYDVIEKSSQRKLSQGLVVDPARAKYFEAKKANGGKVPAVADSITEPPKPVKPAPPKPTRVEGDLAYRDGKWVDAKTLTPAEKKDHDDSFETGKKVGNVRVDPKVEVFQVGGTGKLGFDWDGVGMKNGEITLTPENKYVEVKAKVAQLEGTAAGRVAVGPDGVEATVNLEGKVTLIGLAAETGKAQIGDKNLGASVYARAEAAVLAEAKAQGKAKVGLDGVELIGEAGAFAGAKAKIEVPATVNLGGTETRVTAVGEVSYGIGAEGKAYMKIDWKTLTVKGGAKGHAALGVGAGVDVNIEFSAAELVKQLPSPAEIKAGMDRAYQEIETAVRAAELRVAQYAIDAANRIEASKKIVEETAVRQTIGVINAVNNTRPEEVILNPTGTAVKVAVPVFTEGVRGAQKVQQQFLDSELNRDAYRMRKAIQATPVVPRPVGKFLDWILGANLGPAGTPGFNGGRYANTTFGTDALASRGGTGRADEAIGAGMQRL